MRFPALTKKLDIRRRYAIIPDIDSQKLRISPGNVPDNDDSQEPLPVGETGRGFVSAR